jgi:hypothetical protein
VTDQTLAPVGISSKSAQTPAYEADDLADLTRKKLEESRVHRRDP